MVIVSTASSAGSHGHHKRIINRRSGERARSRSTERPLCRRTGLVGSRTLRRNAEPSPGAETRASQEDSSGAASTT